MQFLDANDLEANPIEGVNGYLSLFPAYESKGIAAQLVVVPPNTKAPKLGTPVKEKMFIFVIQGSAMITNAEYYEKVGPGKMVIIEAGEERVYQTEKEKLVALEVRFQPVKVIPAPTQVFIDATIPSPAPTPTEAPKKPAGVLYEA